MACDVAILDVNVADGFRGRLRFSVAMVD